MTLDEPRQRSERELLAVVSDVLLGYRERLLEVGLHTSGATLRRWDDLGAQRSEITFALLDGIKVFDVVEFFAWDEGSALPVEAVKAGVGEELESAIDRRRRGPPAR